MSDISLPDALGYLVHITDEDGNVLGTGISVATGYVLTSLHVVGPRALADPDAPIRVVQVGGQRPLPATITYADGELDLAMLRCRPLGGPAGHFLASSDVEVGKNVEVLVASRAEGLVRVDGVWRGLYRRDQSVWHGQVAAGLLPHLPGLSGSPVVLPADGSVVGVLLGAGEGGASDLVVVPGEQLATFTLDATTGRPIESTGQVRDQVGVLALSLLAAGDLPIAGEIHSLLGRAAQRTGSFDQAVDFYRVALSCFQALDDYLPLAVTQFRIGQIAEMSGRYSAAREAYQEAVRGYARSEETRGVATALQRLGAATLLGGEPELARPVLERALVAFGLVKDSTGAAITLGYLGAVVAALGDQAGAVEYLRRSRATSAMSAAGLIAMLVDLTQNVAPEAIRSAAIRALPPGDLPAEWRSAGERRQLEGGLQSRGLPSDDGNQGPPETPPADEDDGDPQIINIWVGEREHTPAIPLSTRQRYTLVFRVGAPRPGQQGRGARDIPRSIIPAGGLETAWIVASTDVTLSALADEPYPVGLDLASSGDLTQWMASFALTVPPTGESEERRIAIVPLDPGRARIDVSVSIHGDEYRRLTVDLEVSSPAAPPPSAPPRPVGGGGGESPRAVTTTEVHGPPLHQVAPRASADWQEPPKRLNVDFYSAVAYVTCEKRGLSHPASWGPDVRAVEGRIRQVREALDALRVKQSAYFEGLSPEDLAGRLAGFRPSADWRVPAGASPEPWADLAGCPEVRALADEGYLLYAEFFGPDGDLRRYVDDLEPGDMLALTWHAKTHYVAHVPWALMYREAPEPGQPINPENFLGIRLRLNAISYEMKYNRAMGGTVPTHLMYWGDRTDDPVAVETARHRDELEQWAPRVLPTCTPAKEQVLGFLGDPAPSPVGLVYVYSRALTGTDTGFRFAEGTGADATVTLREIGSKTIPDRPLVFANACGTAAASAYVANDMEARFFLRGCSAFVGTECRVPIAFAARFAATFFHFLHASNDGTATPAGEALAQARRFFFTEYGSLGGLFYSYVNDYYLFLASDDEVAQMSRLRVED
jgi:hypothetical protein